MNVKHSPLILACEEKAIKKSHHWWISTHGLSWAFRYDLKLPLTVRGWKLEWGWELPAPVGSHTDQFSSVFSSVPAVHSAVAKVKHLLGDDSAAGKLFVKFWLAWGHPRAFHTEAEAKLWQELGSLSFALVVHGATPLEAAQQRIKVIMTSDGKVAQRRLMFVAKKLLCGDFDVESGKCSLIFTGKRGLWT